MVLFFDIHKDVTKNKNIFIHFINKMKICILLNVIMLRIQFSRLCGFLSVNNYFREYFMTDRGTIKFFLLQLQRGCLLLIWVIVEKVLTLHRLILKFYHSNIVDNKNDFRWQFYLFYFFFKKRIYTCVYLITHMWHV